MNEYRAPRTLYIEERFGYFYVTDQFGGFSRYATQERAESAMQEDAARYGDTIAAS